MKCPKCGVENRDKAIQCIRCGTFFDAEADKEKEERNNLKKRGKDISFSEALELYVGDSYQKILMNHDCLIFFLGFLCFYSKGYLTFGIIFQILELFCFAICFYYGKYYLLVFLLFGIFYLLFGSKLYLKWVNKKVKILQHDYEYSDMTSEEYKALLSFQGDKWKNYLSFFLVFILFFVVLCFIGHDYFNGRHSKIVLDGWHTKGDLFVYNEKDAQCEMHYDYSKNEDEYQKILKKYQLLLEDGTSIAYFTTKLKNKSGRLYNYVAVGDKTYRIVVYLVDNNSYEAEFFLFTSQGREYNEFMSCEMPFANVIKNIEIK